MQAVILAGGKGRRLQPYTAVFPKPLVPLGDRPILEIVVGQLREAGIVDLTLAVGHLAGLIQAYFGDGSRFGVRIRYSLEEQPLGTAGPLSLLEQPGEDFLVMNGDLLTDLDYRVFADAHRNSGAVATLAVFRKAVNITLGVLDVDSENRVRGYTEKPTLYYDVSSGIYCFRPEVLSFLERGQRCDLPELILRILARNQAVHAFRFDGYWLDIGRLEDYETAIEEVAKGRFG